MIRLLSSVVIILSSWCWRISSFTDAFTPFPFPVAAMRISVGSSTPTATVSPCFLASSSSTSIDAEEPLPSLDQLANDPFMKQVGYGFSLTTKLLQLGDGIESTNTNGNPHQFLEEAIQAQLSHSEGIRGFMVSYLTADSSPADQPKIPSPLMGALRTQMQSLETADDLVSLACMNVIMPTAMVTMHKDPELSAGSARTAQRGLRLLKALKEYSSAVIMENANAILAIATGCEEMEMEMVALDENDDKLFKYWRDFFEKWGYQEAQRADIATAMEDLLQQQ